MRCLVIFANILWLFACLPGWIAFFFFTFIPRYSQLRIRHKLIRQSRGTEIGRKLEARLTPGGWGQLPLTDYSGYESFVKRLMENEPGVLFNSRLQVLEPTGGSGLGTKLIPYNRELQREFARAIAPWIASVFLRHPAVLLGRQYWSISPSTLPQESTHRGVQVGFLSDDEYLGWTRKIFTRILAVAPEVIGRIRDAASHRYLTALCLLHARDLSLISIWHPSFLLLILKCIEENWAELCRDVAAGTVAARLRLTDTERSSVAALFTANRRRTGFLATCFENGKPVFEKIWPGLRVISCWDGPQAACQLEELKLLFPGVHVQGKGLLATEGVVSIPFGREGCKVAACRSHFLEFQERTHGDVVPLWELHPGAEYGVILTAGNGFFRYRLKDRVRVSGRYHRTPCLEFLGKEDHISDLTGEKIESVQAGELLQQLFREMALNPKFAMLAPSVMSQPPGYLLFVASESSPQAGWSLLAEKLEQALLRRNFGYSNSRKAGQLRPAGVFLVRGNAYSAYSARLMKEGMKLGDIKPAPLHRLSGWEDWFPGKIIAIAAG